MYEPRFHSLSTEGPEPMGFSAKALALAASFAPGAAANSFWGMMPVLNVASADGSEGSGRLRLSVTVLPLAATESMELIRPFHAPLSGLRARSRLHFTSAAVIGLPSANLMFGRSVRVRVLPSAETT